MVERTLEDYGQYICHFTVTHYRVLKKQLQYSLIAILFVKTVCDKDPPNHLLFVAGFYETCLYVLHKL